MRANIKLCAFQKNLFSVFANGSYDSLSNLYDNMLIISSMHFMDPYNFDVERIQKSVVHYETPDSKIVLF